MHSLTLCSTTTKGRMTLTFTLMHSLGCFVLITFSFSSVLIHLTVHKCSVQSKDLSISKTYSICISLPWILSAVLLVIPCPKSTYKMCFTTLLEIFMYKPVTVVFIILLPQYTLVHVVHCGCVLWVYLCKGSPGRQRSLSC